MAIDDCQHHFCELASTVLPMHMDRMRDAMRAPHPLRLFGRPGIGVASIAREMSKAGDFSGSYVVLEQHLPIYVGISRGVISRLRQHTAGKTHFDASLAYRMARACSDSTMPRSVAMKHPEFHGHFETCRNKLNTFDVAVIEIRNDLEMYLFEAYCAMEFNTCAWNTFRTH